MQTYEETIQEKWKINKLTLYLFQQNIGDICQLGKTIQE